ncbi:uncharacterized protein LOC106174012 [Lingula anatina]|uniref:Uncharacterized protein LOC106174012 n=1 Tax=Lingula anatina TaxID=7574 RepID=A0A1S3JL21_LINAN|nr:uncharacterized protein LOC106174012 [Lingula anatina]|eukprot:XP_013410836.1 uncharacterized protein LOC106174012 [Lingula anatina]
MLSICSTFALRSARYYLPGIRAISTSSCLLTGPLDDQGHVVIKDKPSQGKHGRPEHAFAPHHCQDLEVLSQIDDAIKETEEMMVGGPETARVHAHAAASAAADTDSPDSNYCDAHSNIDLHCVMQTMVPEPVDTNNGSPSHVNMPGGGQLRNDKYVYDNLHEIYPSRKYHTSARQYSSAPPEPKYWTGTDPCPQGVQGDDCERFKLWLENCRKYGLQDCDREVQGIQEGRKTVAQVIAEQDEMIRKITAHYKKNGDKEQFGQQKRGYASLVFPQRRHYCTKSDPPPPAGEVQLSGAQKLKLAVKDYGSTVVVFHVSLSLASLGGFYLAVTSQRRTFMVFVICL